MTEPRPTPTLPEIRAELLRLMSDVLGQDLPRLPDDTPILEVVVSSLMLVEGMRRIYERFGVLISIRRVIEGQATLGGIALYIEQELRTQQVRSAQRPEPEAAALAAVPARRVRLAPAQQHVAFLTRYSAGAAAAFNEALAVRLAGALDGPALQAALDAVTARYEALRTVLSPDQDELSVMPGQPLELRVSACPDDELAGRLAELVGRPFQPGDRLFRADLLRLSDGLHLLVLVSHALVVEPEALGRVLEELASFYAAYAAGREPDASFPALQWTDYLAMGEADLALQAREAARTFWQGALSGDWPPLELPTDFARPPVKQYAGARVVLDLPPDLVASLRGWAATENVAAAEAVLAAFGLYLGRLAGQAALVVGVRSGPLYLDVGQRVVAQTRTLLPVRVALQPELSFAQHAQRVAAQVREAEQHRHLSLSEMIQLLNPARDQSRSALFTAAFSHRPAATAPAFGTLPATLAQLPTPGARYDLDLTLATNAGGAQVVCDYSTELFTPETIRRWLNGVTALLAAALDDPAQACGALPLLTEAEHQLLLLDWNSTERPYPHDKTVLDLMVRQALAVPDAPAVRCGEAGYSYRQLVSRVEALAGRLERCGVAHGDRVGILLERSPDLPAALLAAWRVGAAYVPLDPSFPPKRLAYMLEDAGARAILTQRSLVPLLPQALADQAICVDEAEEAPPAPVSARAAGPQDSAFVIYTSGSTGHPKGVEIGHRAVTNCLTVIREQVGLRAGEVVLALTTVSFDIALQELLMPLLAGGVVDIAPAAVAADGLSLAALIKARKPDYMQATPSIWKTILAAGWEGEAGLCAWAAGESLSRELAEQLISRCRALWNFYGPTETTIYSVVGRVASAPGQPVPIGRPLANTQLYLLDGRRQPVPLGAIGELYIGGDGLARGYWRRPELTASQFVPHPFREGERLYRTGDLARYLPNGQVVCLGRLDHQVKVHGVRVELGEVEAALSQVPGIGDAAVTTWQDERGDVQLVAHVIRRGGAAPTVAEIRTQLRERLPEVMVPPYILFAEAFPMTANGKVRRADLPAPDRVSRPDERPLEAPQTVSERLLAGAWARVLGLDHARIGRDADFLDLGGHSLLMTPLLLEVRKLFKVSFALREFFGASTLRAQARLIDERRAASADQADGGQPGVPARSAEWGRQRMAFLLREAQLPAGLSPARGMSYQAGGPLETVFLTGSTGFLGAYLIAEMLQTTRAELYCLVRPQRGQPGKDRIEAVLRRYALWGEDERWRADWQTRLHAVEGDVTLPRLGMPDALYETLARQVDAILHGAAHVNFIYPYEALRATNVLGLHEMVRFAFHGRIKPVHHLSTAAIWPMGAHYTFWEKDSIEHGQALNLGYDEAKWVAERCLLWAEERGLPVARYRPGEVGGDSVTGRCVTDHFVVASIKGFVQFGAFPALDMEIDVAPIDYVARAMVYLMFNRSPLGRAFHLTNPHRMHMRQALTFLREQGYRFEELRFSELRDHLLGSPGFGANALFPYQAILEEMDDISLQLPNYDTRETQRELRGSGITCAPADEALFGLYLNYLRSIGYMPEPERQPAPG